MIIKFRADTLQVRIISVGFQVIAECIEIKCDHDVLAIQRIHNA
jgi:hypothetical protein